MAELAVTRDFGCKMVGELCVFRSRVSDEEDGANWEVKENLPISLHEDEYLDVSYWNADTVIPFKNKYWVDYHRGGILFCYVFEKVPNISSLRLPIDDRPLYASHYPFLERKRSVCVTEGGLKFVNVVRDDGKYLSQIQPGTGFTITSHTLDITEEGEMRWDHDFNIKSDELWTCNCPERLPREVLMYPLLSMDRPHVAHFLLFEYQDEIDKVFRVTIDVSTKAVPVVSIAPYIEGEEDLHGKDADMVIEKSNLLQSFLPSSFPSF